MTGFAEYESFDGIGLAELVRRREVHPRELVEACLERISERNPAINAVVHRMDEAALAAAEEPVPAGPLAGVPFLLKDLLAAVAGEPLSSSCRFLAAFVPDHDSEVVRRHRKAGLLLAGKTNTPELGIMGVTEPVLHGPTRNPWNLAHTPGGSSGGSAAAVAAGLVPLAHGNDGGGSIRIPASCCGLFGLKPSRGRVPIGPDVAESLGGLVQEHGLTRSVRDSAALLDVTHGPEPGALYTAPPPQRPFLEEAAREPGRLRIAFTTESLLGERTHPECRRAAEDAAALCASLAHHVEEARPQVDKGALRRAYLLILAVDIAHAIELAGAATGRRPTPAGFEPSTWLLGLIGRRITATQLQAARDHLHAARLRVDAFFQDHDLLLTPTMPLLPVRIGALDPSRSERAAIRVLRAFPARRLLLTALDEMARDPLEPPANTMLFNQTGQPAMSVPLAWSDQGLPIGVQFAARYGEEATLLSLAGQLERARPWWNRRPAPVPASQAPRR